MATVQEILTDIPRPTFSFRSGYGAPLPPELSVSRAGGGETLSPVTNYFEKVTHDDTERIYGDQQALLIEATKNVNRLYNRKVGRGLWDGTDRTAATGIDGSNEGSLLAQTVGTTEGVVAIPENNRWVSVSIFVHKEDSPPSPKFDMKLVDTTSDGGVGDQYERFELDTSTGDIVNRTINEGVTRVEEVGGWWRIMPSLLNDGTLDEGGISIYHENTNIRVDTGQVELGKNVSEPIFAYSSQKTKNREVGKLDLRSQWNKKGGTFVVEFMPLMYHINDTTRILGKADTYFQIESGSTPPYRIGINNSGPTTYPTPRNINAYEYSKVAVTFDQFGGYIASNGESGSFSSPGGPGSGLSYRGGASVLEIGEKLQAHVLIRRLDYIPRYIGQGAIEHITAA